MAETEERIRNLEQRLAQAEARIAQLEAHPRGMFLSPLGPITCTADMAAPWGGMPTPTMVKEP